MADVLHASTMYFCIGIQGVLNMCQYTGAHDFRAVLAMYEVRSSTVSVFRWRPRSSIPLNSAPTQIAPSCDLVTVI